MSYIRRSSFCWRSDSLGFLPRNFPLARATAMPSRVRSLIRATDGSMVWQLGLAPWRLHDLRRTASTGMGRLGVPRFIIERVLNHADRT